MKALDLTGQKFGRLTVQSKSERRYKGSRQSIWLCKCDCGKNVEVVMRSLRHGNTKSCGCLSRDVHWKGYEEISGRFFGVMKDSAKVRKHLWEVTPEYLWTLYLTQERKCALSGLPISFERNPWRYKKAQSASLDRINSSMGYIEGNVQWLHKDINMMKQRYSQEYFLEMCRKVAENIQND